MSQFTLGALFYLNSITIAVFLETFKYGDLYLRELCEYLILLNFLNT